MSGENGKIASSCGLLGGTREAHCRIFGAKVQTIHSNTGFRWVIAAALCLSRRVGIAGHSILISQSPATALELGQTPQEVAMYALNHGVIQDAPKPPDAFVEWLKRHVPTLASAPAGSATPPLALSSSFGGGDGGAGRLSPKPNVFVPPQGRSAINRVPVMELPPPVFAPAVSSTLDAKHSLQPSDFAQFAAANSASNSFDHYQPQSSYATMMVPESYPRSHNHYSADLSSRYSRSALPEMFHIAIPEQRLLSLQLNRKICLSTRKFRPTLL